MAAFLSLLFVALALGPALGHLFELPNKIELPAERYLLVQHLYNGWALLGIVVVGALGSTLATALLTRDPRALAAFVCIAGAQAVFWIFTFPANQRTHNWTTLPANWESLRTQWEYSHAAGAFLMLAAMISLILFVLRS